MGEAHARSSRTLRKDQRVAPPCANSFRVSSPEVLRARRARFPRQNGNPWLMLKPARGVRKMAPHPAARKLFALAMAQQRNHIAAHESRQILNHRCGVEQCQLRGVDTFVGVLRDAPVCPGRYERPVLRSAPPARREIRDRYLPRSAGTRSLCERAGEYRNHAAWARRLLVANMFAPALAVVNRRHTDCSVDDRCQPLTGRSGISR